MTYNGVGEIVVDSSNDELSTLISLEVTDSVILATGGLLRLYIDAILAAVRAVYQFLAKSVAPADVIELSDLSSTTADASEGVSQVTATVAKTGVEATVTTASSVSQVVTVAFIVLGIGVLVVEFSLKDFVHSLSISNLTDLDLDLDLELETLDPHFIDNFAGTTQGKFVAKPATSSLAKVFTAGELTNVTTAQYVTTNRFDVTDFEYLLRFKSNAEWPQGFTFEYQVPFFDGNRFGGTFDIPEMGWKQNATLKTDAKTQIVVESGADISRKYQAIQTFNKLLSGGLGGGHFFSGSRWLMSKNMVTSCDNVGSGQIIIWCVCLMLI